jgi:hypothetical protein
MTMRLGHARRGMIEPAAGVAPKVFRWGRRVVSKVIIRVPGLKVAVPLAADALPRDLVPADGPAGEPTIDLVLDGGSLTAQAKLNGKNYRKMLKQIAEQGAGNVAVVLQGVLRPPAAPGGPFVLEGAGFQVNVKTPRPAEPAGEPPQETHR